MTPDANALDVGKARDALDRFINLAFDKDGDRPHFSIPANPECDDDLILSAALSRLDALEAENAKLTAWREEVRAIHNRVVKRWPAWSEEDSRFLALALCGEVGELANLLKKKWRGDQFGPGRKPEDFDAAVLEELADVRIYLELLAGALGVDLDAACDFKMPELRRRWPDPALAALAPSDSSGARKESQ